MKFKANCKINLGLRILGRRDDGYHDIETVMFPVKGLFDTVSVSAMPSETTFAPATPLPYPSAAPVFPTDSVIEVSGIGLDCPPEENICMKALRLVQHRFGVGEAVIGLHKAIPAGAGLGGGSSDAAAVLSALDREFVLGLTRPETESLAGELGSDVPFFVRNTPMLCTGRGEVMTPVEVSLAGHWLVIVKPPVEVSTAEAYSQVVAHKGGVSVAEAVAGPVGLWRDTLVNDFEESVFARHPEIAALKAGLYDAGALYASMSGSGSAVYGIFEKRPEPPVRRDGSIFVHVERL